MPHIIACRAAHPVKEKVREKISMYTNVPMKRVVTMHDVESIYTIPEALRERAWTAKCSRCSTCTTASISEPKTRPA